MPNYTEVADAGRLLTHRPFVFGRADSDNPKDDSGRPGFIFREPSGWVDAAFLGPRTVGLLTFLFSRPNNLAASAELVEAERQVAAMRETVSRQAKEIENLERRLTQLTTEREEQVRLPIGFEVRNTRSHPCNTSENNAEARAHNKVD